MKHFFIISLLVLPVLSVLGQDTNDSSGPKRFNLHFQTTYIYQYMPAFYSPYNGVNSLKGAEQKQNSLTATLCLGIRLWKNCDIYINPEIAGGSGLSGAFGLAASTNGETYRVGDPAPQLYLARGYIQQTIRLGKGSTSEADVANQCGGIQPAQYIRFLAGKFSLADIFDNNAFSSSPRTQFMNWAIMNNAAWDYAANVRGYTYSFATIVQLKDISYKIAIAALPTVANGPDLNTDLSRSYSINAEVAKGYKIGEKAGLIRMLGYYNRADMGSYRQAISASDSGQVPNIISTREYGRSKTGLGLNMEQQLTGAIGLFGRVGWNNGATETWCYTEADQTITGGLSINGKGWQRKDDNTGIAIVVNGLSKDHRDYLADGGLGFELGDGKLSYNNEAAVEWYYSYKPVAYPIWISGDYQFVANPGYNQARGPVNVFSLRVHVEL